MKPRPIHVLVVDDERPVLAMMKLILQEAGYHVHAAEIGSDGLSLFEQRSHWDMAILDRAMPIMSGEELAAQLRKAAAGLPIMMVTGNIHAIREPGLFQEVLAKPFRASELLEKVNHMLRELSRQ